MRNRKYVLIIVVFILLGVVAFFLAGNNDSESKNVTLYFLDKDRCVITPVETEIKADNDSELFTRVAEALIKGPESKKYLPIMDSGVTVKGIDIQNGNLTINFSGNYPKDYHLCTYAVIKTFSRLSGVDSVRVTAGGQEIPGTDGVALGFVNGDDINTESAEDTATGIRLYFANASGNELVMEYRKINIVDTQPVEQYIITELIKGPNIENGKSLLAPDTKVLSVETTDGICYVNFKKGFIEKNAEPFGGPKLLVDSIVKSLTTVKNVEGVQFLVEGKKTEKLGSVDISGIFGKEKPPVKVPEEADGVNEPEDVAGPKENTN